MKRSSMEVGVSFLVLVYDKVCKLNFNLIFIKNFIVE